MVAFWKKLKSLYFSVLFCDASLKKVSKAYKRCRMEEALLLEHESRKQKQAEEEMDGLISSLHCDVVTMHQQHQGVGRGESQGGDGPNSPFSVQQKQIHF